jgi:cytochrome c-type biogenesis protein CcmH
MNKLWIYIAMMVGIVGLALPAATPTSAQGPTPNIDDQVNQIAKNLYCPVCPNTPLDVCSTQACADWRNDIKTLLLQGKNEQQIRDYFVARFGPQVLGAPPAEGFNWLAYVLIPLFILLGAVIAWITLRHWLSGRQAASATAAEAPPIPKEYADRIEKELKEY